MTRRWVAATTTLAIGVVVVTAGSTRASWRDTEWASGTVGVLDCAALDGYATRGEGRFLSGDALTLALDQVVEVPGVVATHDGTTSTRSAGVAVGGDAYVNPLTPQLLSTIGVDLTSVITLPLSAEVGVVNQYGRASADGTSAGASGLVDDSGAVQVRRDPTGPELPVWATVRLSTLVSQLTGKAVSDLVAGVTDLSLELGAVAARAELDGCVADYRGDLSGALQRDYAIAALDARVSSPAVATLTTAGASTVAAVDTLLATVAGSSGVTSEITSGVGELLTGKLETLGLGGVSVNGLAITADLSRATALLTGTVSDSRGLVAVDLGAGTVTVDLAAALGAAYGGTDGTLNGLPPNTELLIDDAVLATITGALTEALADWVEDLLGELTAAVLAATVAVDVGLTLTALGSPVATVTATIQQASLSSLLDGTARVSVQTSVALLDALCAVPIAGLPFCALGATVDGVLSGLTGLLTKRLGPLVGNALEAAIFEEVGGERLLRVDLVPLNGAVTGVVTVVSSALSGFFGTDGLASLLVNVQNRTTRPGPADREALPTGRFAVGALRIGVLDALGPGLDVHLDLATAAVGANARVGR